MFKISTFFLFLLMCLSCGCRHRTQVNTYHIRSKDDGPLWCGYQKGLTKEDSVFFNSNISIYMGVPGYGEKCLDTYADSTQYRLMYEGAFGLYIVRINPHEVTIKVNGERFNEKEMDIRNLTPQEQKEYLASWYVGSYRDSSSKKIKDSIKWYEATFPRINDLDYRRYLEDKRYGFVNDTVFYKLVTIPISTVEFERIGQKINTSDFWHTKSYNDHAIEADGSWWVLEAKERSKYHYVYFDEIFLNRKIRNVCMEFLKYTNADTAKIE